MNDRIPPENDALREATGDAAELARAVRISLCGIGLDQPATFVPASLATADFDWQAWLGEEFVEEIGPAFVEMYRAAGSMHARELMEVDRLLKGEGSRIAGSALLDKLEEAKNLRVIERMRSLIGESEGPHFATAFAVECAEFHLPLRSALVSYLYGEWRCGTSALGKKGDLEAFAAAGGGLVVRVVSKLLSAGASPFEHAAAL